VVAVTSDARDWEQRADELAAASLATGSPTDWFDQLYADGVAGRVDLPWDRRAPNPQLAQWAEAERIDGAGRRAVVVGAGLGADAAYLAGLGFDAVAFDISDTAVQIATERFDRPNLRFVTANLLALQQNWQRAFDLVVEIFTVQALPRSLRTQATAAVGALVADKGTLVVIASALESDDDPDDGPPWPLTRREVETFAGDDLDPVRIEALPFSGRPGGHRWLAEFHRGMD
jgi:Thiopurine S-methyltransferase (TPMT)